MPPEPQKATVTDIAKLNEDHTLFTLTPEKPFTFKAGQFLMIQFTDAEGTLTRRSYSIASPPSQNTIELCIRIVPDGKAGKYLSNLKKGDVVQISGPFGHFTVPDGETADVILIGAGTGIAPMRGIYKDLLAKGHAGKVHLFFGFRYISDFLFKDEIEELTAKHPNFIFHPICSRDENWKGDRGHVQSILEKYVPQDGRPKRAFVCGMMKMCQECQTVLEKLGVPAENIKIEGWG
ncbi:Sulfhydrogenase 2 subunit gamma [uncultured archaeon]|nr:Sulfhydrogenase 2 subunit gamma [uncultured archaeon]